MKAQVKFGNTRASQWRRYSTQLPPFEERLRESVRWLKEDRMDLVVMYHDNPDVVGHEESPDAASTRFVEELNKTDQYIGL